MWLLITLNRIHIIQGFRLKVHICIVTSICYAVFSECIFQNDFHFTGVHSCSEQKRGIPTIQSQQVNTGSQGFFYWRQFKDVHGKSEEFYLCSACPYKPTEPIPAQIFRLFSNLIPNKFICWHNFWIKDHLHSLTIYLPFSQL